MPIANQTKRYPTVSSPTHVPGTTRGEEMLFHKGPEPGRETGKRTARDSTSVNPHARDPIDPRMPYLPPA